MQNGELKVLIVSLSVFLLFCLAGWIAGSVRGTGGFLDRTIESVKRMFK